MSTEFERLRDDLLMLPIESRASLAHALIQSRDEEADENAGALWARELRRRDAENKGWSREPQIRGTSSPRSMRTPAMLEIELHEDADDETQGSGALLRILTYRIR